MRTGRDRNITDRRSLLLSGMTLAGTVGATEFRKGQTVETVAKDEVIHGDLFISGERARIEGNSPPHITQPP